MADTDTDTETKAEGYCRKCDTSDCVAVGGLWEDGMYKRRWQCGACGTVRLVGSPNWENKRVWDRRANSPAASTGAGTLPSVSTSGNITVDGGLMWTDNNGQKHEFGGTSTCWPAPPDIKAQVKVALDEWDEEKADAGGACPTESEWDALRHARKEAARLKAENAKLRIARDNWRGDAWDKESEVTRLKGEAEVLKAENSTLRIDVEIRQESSAGWQRKWEECRVAEEVLRTQLEGAEAENAELRAEDWRGVGSQLRSILIPAARMFCGPPFTRDAEGARLLDLAPAVCGALENIARQRDDLQEQAKVLVAAHKCDKCTDPELGRVTHDYIELLKAYEGRGLELAEMHEESEAVSATLSNYKHALREARERNGLDETTLMAEGEVATDLVLVIRALDQLLDDDMSAGDAKRTLFCLEEKAAASPE